MIEMAVREVDWNICCGLPTRTYRNLNNGLMSIQQKVKNSWIVVGHLDNLVLKSTTFHVSEVSRQRVLKEGRKNVHAYGQGFLVGKALPKLPSVEPVFYCPFQQSYFSWQRTGERLDRADLLIIIDNQVYCPVEETQSQLALF
jgi:hypothetical protein